MILFHCVTCIFLDIFVIYLADVKVVYTNKEISCIQLCSTMIFQSTYFKTVEQFTKLAGCQLDDRGVFPEQRLHKAHWE